MANFNLSAAVVFKATDALAESKKLSDNLKTIGKETGMLSRMSTINIGRMKNDLMKLGVAGAGAFAMMMNASPELASALDGITYPLEEIFWLLGDAIAPVIEDKIVPLVEQLVGWFKTLDTDTQLLIATIILATAMIIPLITVLTTLATVVAVILSPIGLIILALAALYFAYQYNFLGIKDIVDELFSYMKDEIMAFVDQNKESFEEIIQLMKDIWVIIEPILRILGEAYVKYVAAGIKKAFDQAMITIQFFVTFLKGFLKIVKGILTLDFGLVMEGVGDIVDGGMTYIKDSIKNTFDYILEIFNIFKDAFLGVVSALFGDDIAGKLSVFMDAIGKLFNIPIGWINELIIDNINSILNEIAKLVDKIPSVSKPHWEIPSIPTFHEGTFGQVTTGEGMAMFKPKETMRTESQEALLQQRLRRGGSEGGGRVGSVTNHFHFPNMISGDRDAMRMLAREMSLVDKRERQRRGIS